MLAFFRASDNSVSKYSLVDQTVDEYVDATGIDAGNSTNEVFISGVYGSESIATTTGGTKTTYTSGGTDYTVHTFTSSGNFVTDVAGTADILVVGGGGGAGGGINGSGGGAGGMVVSAATSTLAQTYAVVVGTGGAGGPAWSTAGDLATQGVSSSINVSGVATAVGGGGGINYAKDLTGTAGSGGSGGGGPENGTGGSATSGQGNAGATGAISGVNATGGGGGAGAAGSGRYGGVGLQNAYQTGSNIYYAGGGSGGEDNNRPDRAGGLGGGGIGRGTSGNGAGGAGTDGLGGGGGGAGESRAHAGGDGGNGVVIIRFSSTMMGSVGNLTLQSVATTAESAPTTGDIVMLIEDATGTATINTDIKAYISRNGSAFSSQVTLTDEGDWGTNKRILAAHDVDLSGITSGTSMKYKITTHNQSSGSKITKIHATSLAWA